MRRILHLPQNLKPGAVKILISYCLCQIKYVFNLILILYTNNKTMTDNIKNRMDDKMHHKVLMITIVINNAIHKISQPY